MFHSEWWTILWVMQRITIIIMTILLLTIGASAEVLTLDEAISRGLDRNPRVRSSQTAARAAEFRVDQAYASYAPSLDLGATYTHSESERGSANVVSGGQLLFGDSQTGSGSMKRDAVGTSISARMPIFDGRREPAIRQVKESLLSTEYEAELAAQELILEIRTLYYGTLLDQELVEIQKQRVENTELRLQQARGFHETGRVALNEVTQAEAELAAARLEASRAEAALELDWVKLNELMGESAQTQYELRATEPPEAPEVSVESLIEIALDERPELLAGWARVRAQLARIDAAVAERLPTLSASAGYNLNGQPSPLNRTWSAGLSLSWSLFDGGLTKARTEEAKANAQQLAEQMEVTGNTVYREIVTALTEWRTAEVQIETAQAGVAAAEQNRYLASQRYEIGVGSSLELSDADLSLVQAKTELARAVNATRTAAAKLARAVGIVDIAELPRRGIS